MTNILLQKNFKIMEKKTIRLTENQLKYIISETAKKLIEAKYNYKNQIKKMIAAQHAAGKSPEERREELDNWFAKAQAIQDINKDRNVLDMDPHEREFNNAVRYDTFDIDFEDWDEDDFAYNNQQINYDQAEREPKIKL